MFSATRSWGQVAAWGVVLLVCSWPLTGFWMVIPIAISLYIGLKYANSLESRDREEMSEW